MHEESEASPPGAGELAVLRGTSAGIGGIVGMLVGGPEGALIGAAATPGIEAIVVAGRERAVHRANDALETAAGRLGLHQRAFVNHVLSDDRRLLLTLQVVQAASKTFWKEKVRLLGRVLANGLENGTRLDEAEFIAATINDIEPPHVEVLAYILQGLTESNSTVRTSAIKADLPLFGETIFAILAALDRHGLIGQPPNVWPGDSELDVDQYWGLTPYGRRILAMLRELD